MCKQMMMAALLLLVGWSLAPVRSVEAQSGEAAGGASNAELRSVVREAVTEAVQPVQENLSRLEDRLKTVEELWVALDRDVKSLIDRDAQGNAFLAINKAMAHEESRRQLTAAVHDSMQRQGTLRIRNRMASGYRILVNGSEVFVPANEDRTVSVAVGTVVTELRGFESPKNWTIGPPDYFQSIDINPRPAEQVTFFRGDAVERTVLMPAPVERTVWMPAAAPVVASNVTFAVTAGSWVYDPFWGWVYWP